MEYPVAAASAARPHATEVTYPGPLPRRAGPEAARADGPHRVLDGPYPDLSATTGTPGRSRSRARAAVAGRSTVIELSRSPVPVLRLVTGGSVAETRVSGARAGRGAVELGLPDVPTVSREHARFTFSDGRWWIANLGRNGLTLNGTALAGEQPLSSGDSIRWGMRSDALLSRVEIG